MSGDDHVPKEMKIMRWKRTTALLAVSVVGLVAGGLAVSGAQGTTTRDGVEQFVPDDFQLENLPDRVAVAGPDGEPAGYVDKNLLLARSRRLPLPDDMSPLGPFPVYDADGIQIGTWHHERGFVSSTGETVFVPASPTTVSDSDR